MSKKFFRSRRAFLNITGHDWWGFALIAQVIILMIVTVLLKSESIEPLLWVLWALCLAIIVQLLVYMITSERQHRRRNRS